MITIHGKCNMCGGLAASVEVEVPHATDEKRRANSVSSRGVLCAAICRECARAVTAAWAEHGGKTWASSTRLAAELAKDSG